MRRLRRSLRACMGRLPRDMQGLVIKDFVRDFVALIEPARFNGVTPLKAVELGFAAMLRMSE